MIQYFPILLVLGLATSSARGDRIIFVDGMELEGTVLKQGELDVTVKVDRGNIKLLKSRIDRIELDVEERLKEMESSNTKGFLDLARLCEEYNDEDGMLKCLANAAGNSDVPADRVFQLAEMYEKRGMMESFKSALARYLELDPGRKDIQEKLEALETEEERNKRMQKKEEGRGTEQGQEKPSDTGELEGIAKAGPGTPTVGEQAGGAETAKGGVEEGATGQASAGEMAVPSQEAPEKKPEDSGAPGVSMTQESASSKPAAGADRPQVEEGLETDKGWQIQDWGNPADFQIEDQGGPVKNLLARISFTKADKDKAAIRLDYRNDLTKTKAILFDAFNGSDRTVRIAGAVVTLPGWVFFESPMVTIPPQKWMTQRRIRLDSDKFKCEESKWEYHATIKNLNKVGQIIFLIYHDVPQGHIYLDNIKFVSAEEAESSGGGEDGATVPSISP